MARNRYLTRQGFRQFLADNADVSVGRSRTIDDCPVSLYLEDVTKRVWHASPLQCVPQVDAEVEENEFRTPRWAKDFIHKFDREFPTPVSVTGAEALYILNEMVR